MNAKKVRCGRETAQTGRRAVTGPTGKPNPAASSITRTPIPYSIGPAHKKLIFKKGRLRFL